MSRSVAVIRDRVIDACASLESAADRIKDELAEVRRKVDVFADGGNSIEDPPLIEDWDMDGTRNALDMLNDEVKSSIDRAVDYIREAQREISLF